MRCWGLTTRQQACRHKATTWCVLANVRFAMCDAHASANRGRRQRSIGNRKRGAAVAR